MSYNDAKPSRFIVKLKLLCLLSNMSKQAWQLSQNINKQKGECNFCKSVR